jgi:GPH family glycoside/pentoside/hexuronide:cation symporter
MIVSFSLGVVALALNGSLGLHFLKYYVEVSGSVTLSTFQAVFFTAGVLGTLFWLRISSRFDKHYLYVISTSVTAVISLAALALFGNGHPLGTGNARALMIGYGLAGFFSCVVWFIPQSMLADVADHGELMAGQRREGALFGMFSFAQQVATGVAVLLAGGLLERFVRLVPGASQQPGTVASRIGIVYGVVPAALLLASALLMLSYPLTRARVESLQVELQQRRLAQQAANAG